MKKALTLVLVISAAIPVFAASNLYEYFEGRLPSISERAGLYEAVFEGETYTGTAAQNEKYLAFLKDIGEKDGAEPRLGASVGIPSEIALFETTLASAITSSATSMTLTSATDVDGTALASSTYAFIIDEGSASEEMVIADCTSTACTNMTRGISARTGTTTVTALKKSHRRGASVKITDGPFLVQVSQILRGRQNIETLLQYKDTVVVNSSSASTTIVTKDYVDTQINAGCSDANTTTRGCVEIATRTEVASSTSTGGTSAVVVIPASAATSTPGANITASGGTGETYVPVTEDDGKLNQNFLDLTENFEFSGTVSVASGTPQSSGVTVGATTTTANLAISSSTISVGGKTMRLTLPSSFASTTGLQSNGGNEFIMDRYDDQILCEQRLTAPNATTTCSWDSGISASLLEVTFFNAGIAGGDYATMTFNTDYAGNGTRYGYHLTENAVGIEGGESVARIKIGGLGTTTAQLFTMDIVNLTSFPKLVTVTGVSSTTAPDLLGGSGLWSNTNSQITQINIRTNTVTNSFATDSYLIVKGLRR